MIGRWLQARRAAYWARVAAMHQARYDRKYLR